MDLMIVLTNMMPKHWEIIHLVREKHTQNILEMLLSSLILIKVAQNL